MRRESWLRWRRRKRVPDTDTDAAGQNGAIVSNLYLMPGALGEMGATMAGWRGKMSRWVFWTTLGTLLVASGLGPAATAQEPSPERYTTTMIPPYASSVFWGGAFADHRTGLLAVFGASANGLVSVGGGAAWVGMVHHIPEDAALIEYEILLARSVAVAPSVSASVSTSAFAFAPDGQVARSAADDGVGPTVLSLRLENPGGVVPAGHVNLSVRMSGWADSCAIGSPGCFLSPGEQEIWNLDYAATFIGQATVQAIIATVHPAPQSETQEGEFELQAVGYKEQGRQKANLTWTNATSASIDVVRDDEVVATTENDGAFTDHIDGRGQGSYVYRVCEAGTATCSNEAVVEF